MIILRSQELILRIVTYSIYSEVLSQKPGFLVYGREFASFTYPTTGAEIKRPSQKVAKRKGKKGDWGGGSYGGEDFLSCRGPGLSLWRVFESRLAGVFIWEGLLMGAIPIFQYLPIYFDLPKSVGLLWG